MSIMPPAPLPSLAETITRLNAVAGQLEQHSGDIAATIERQLATFLGNAANQLGERQAQLAPVIASFGAALLQIGGILGTLGTEEEGILAGAMSAIAAQPEDEPAVERMATEAYAGVVAQAAAALNALVEGELATLQARLRTAGLENNAAPSLLRPGGTGPRLPMNMDSVNSVAAKYGIDLSNNTILINKAIAGLRGSTARNLTITLYRNAFENEEQLAITLVHEQYHVQQLLAGMPYPTSYDAASTWEMEAENHALTWWASVQGR